VILSFASSIVFLVGSTALADFCKDSPDEQVLQFLRAKKASILLDHDTDEKKEDHLSTLSYDMAIYYVNQCPIDEIPTGLTNLLDFGWDFAGALWEVSRIMIEFHHAIEGVCFLPIVATDTGSATANVTMINPNTNSSSILELGEIAQQASCDFSLMLQDFVDFFHCENWYV